MPSKTTWYTVEGGSGTHRTLTRARREQAKLARATGYPKSAYQIKKYTKDASGLRSDRLEENPSPKIPIGKFLPARLNRDGSISIVVPKGTKLSKNPSKGPLKVKNISEGFVDATGFHPIRHASDYRPEALSGSEGERARSGRRVKPKTKKAKKAVKKTAKKRAR